MNRETTPSIPQLLQRAQVLYNADRLDEAAALYLWIMLEEPRHAPAHHMMGLMPHQKARNEEALQLIGHAIALDVRASEPQHDLAVVLGAMGRTDDSRAALEGLVVIAPDFPLGHYSLGDRKSVV